jgi:alginate O-acetyltransferase complex protein AlgI
MVMWLWAGGLFFGGKIALLIRHRPWRKTPLRRVLAYTFLWPGMDTRPWVAGRTAGSAALKQPVAFALLKMGLGALLLWGAAPLIDRPLARGWVGMIGLIFLLHFGSFHLLAIFWQRRGIPVVPIMQNPIAATTLADFWGRRWNRAFRDLAYPLLFHPLARHLGPHAALWITYLLSGLAHELVISVPACGGYGLPTLYFLLQAFGISLEKKFPFKNPVTGWLRTHAFTAMPAVILFHPPFVERVMIPFFNLLGAQP